MPDRLDCDRQQAKAKNVNDEAPDIGGKMESRHQSGRSPAGEEDSGEQCNTAVPESSLRLVHRNETQLAVLAIGSEQNSGHAHDNPPGDQGDEHGEDELSEKRWPGEREEGADASRSKDHQRSDGGKN